MAARAKVSPEYILAEHPQPIQELAARTRAIVGETVPDRTERAYPGWHGIGFRHPQAGYFCGLFPSDRQIQIVFEHGRALSDPAGLLQGDTKQTRHITLSSHAELEEAEPAFRALLLESLDYGLSLKTGGVK